jgi:hypothetical protein
VSDTTEPPPLTEREMAELRSMYGVYQVNRAIERLRWLERELAQRTAERRVFYIDVGNLPKAKAEQYLKEIMNRYRRTYDLAEEVQP